MAEMQTWADYMAASPEASSAPKTWDDYMKPQEPRSLIKEIPIQAYAGATIDLPKMVGQAMQWMGAEEAGKKIADWATLREQENPDLAPQVEGRGLLGRALSTGARALPPSAAMIIPAAVASPLGAVAAGGAAAVGAFGLFGGSQAQETYDKLVKDGVDPEQAKTAGWINLMIEGGGETLGTMAGVKLFGIGAKALGAMTPVQSAIKSATTGEIIKPFAKQLPKTLAIEMGTEFGQNAGEAVVENAYGSKEGVSPWVAGVQGAEAALGMTLLLGPFGLGGFALRAKQNERVAAALENPETDPIQRVAASKIIYDAINEVNPDAAKAWSENASYAITSQAPILLDETFAQPRTAARPTGDAAIQSILNAASADEAIAVATAPEATAPVSEPAQPSQGLIARTMEQQLGNIATDADQAIAEAQKAAEMDAIQAGTAPVTEQPKTLMAIRMQEAQDRAQEATRLQAEQTAAAEQEAQQAAATAAAEAKKPQLAELPTLEAINRRQPVPEADQAAMVDKGFAQVREDGSVSLTQEGARARSRLTAPPKGLIATAQAAPVIAPQTIAGAPAASHTTEALQTLATAPETPANTRRAAAEEIKARTAEVQSQATNPDISAETQTPYVAPQATVPATQPAVEPAVTPAIQPAQPGEVPAVEKPSAPALLLSRPITEASDRALKQALTGRKRKFAQAELDRRAAEKAAKPLTEAQIAHQANLSKRANARKVWNSSDSLIHAVIKLGGLKIKDRNDVIGDKGNQAIPYVGYLFSRTGQGLDTMASAMHERGYLTDEEFADGGGVKALADKLRNDFGSREPKHFAAGNQDARFDAEMRAQQDLAQEIAAESEKLGIEPVMDAAPEDLQAEGIENPTAEQIALADAFATALTKLTPEQIADLDERFDSLAPDEFQRAVINFAKEQASGQRDTSENLGGGEENRPAPTSAPAEVARPAFDLAAQTKDDLAAKAAQAESEKAAEKAVADQEAALPLQLTPQTQERVAAPAMQAGLFTPTGEASAAAKAKPAAEMTPAEHLRAAADKLEAATKPAAKTPEQIYDASLEAFRKASREFTAIRDQYRAQTIGDTEFLAAKAEFEKAQAVSDAAETAFIESKNAATKPANSFTVERLVDGELQPTTFERGEYAKVLLSGSEDTAKWNEGEITGISHARGEAKIGAGDLWYNFGSIYKAERPAPAAPKVKPVPLSSIVESVNAKHGAELTEADRVPVEPGTLAAHDTALNRARDGELSLDEFKAAFASAVANKDRVTEDLSKLTKDQLERRIGRRYGGTNKEAMVRMGYTDVLTDFALGEGISYAIGGRDAMENAIREMVDKTTEEDLKAFAQRVAEAKAAREARSAQVMDAIKDPQTLADFETFLRVKKESDLTPEQLRRYDDLRAAEGRERRQAEDVRRSRVEASREAVGAQIIETKHTKKGHDLFVVQLEKRVDREDYTRLNTAAKRLGGYYSSFKGAGAVPGFQFTTRENAEAFSKLAGGDTQAATEAVQVRRESRRESKKNSAAERLADMADRMEEAAQESLSKDRLANTARRARMANSAEAEARANERMAKTLRAISDAIEEGKATNLDGIRNRTQVVELESILRSAKYDAIRKESDKGGYFEENRDRAPKESDVALVTYPRYRGYRSAFADAARRVIQIPGAKMAGERLLKLTDDSKDYAKAVSADQLLLGKVILGKRMEGAEISGEAIFKTKSAAEAAVYRSGARSKAMVIPLNGKAGRGVYAVVLSPAEAKGRGLWTPKDDPRIFVPSSLMEEIIDKVAAANSGKPWNQQIDLPFYFDNVRESRKRLKGMGIENSPELRAALREYIGLREQEKSADRVKQLERALAGNPNVGIDFFPTPANLAERMVEALEVKPGMSVLEPSAGKGNLADAVREAEPGAQIDAVEQSSTLREILEAKKYSLVGSDFMDFDPEEKYDRIIMNPPFSNNTDAEHVMRAYDMLKPGGKLVAITGEGIFSRGDSKAKAFREWFDSVDGTSEQLDGAFTERREVRTTGVNSRMLVIDKPETDTGTAMFSQGQQSGITEQTLRAEISEAFGPKAENMVGNILVPLQTQADIAAVSELADVVPLIREGDRISGFYHPATGKTYAILENLSAGEVSGLVLHELGVHYGLEGMLGADRYAQVIRQMDVMRKAGNKAVIEAHEIAVKQAARESQIPEEEIAYLVTNHQELPFVRRLIAEIKAFLFRKFGILANKLTPDDIAALARASVLHASEGVQAGEAQFARRIFQNGYRTARDFIVPETPEYDGNMSGDLAIVPDEAAKGMVEALPVRLSVGIARGEHLGSGIMHMKDNADREARREPPSITSDRAENFARNTVAVLRGTAQIYTQGPNKIIIRSTNTKQAIVAARKESNGGQYYSVITILPSENSVWGKPVWVGRLTFPTTGLQQSVAPGTVVGQESTATNPERAGVQTEKFDFTPKQPTVQYKGRKLGDPQFSRAQDQTQTEASFSRNVEAPSIAGSNTTGDFKDGMAKQATDFVADYFKGFDKLSWWQRTVGTPFHLALGNAEFRPFYDEEQAFINDVSRFGNESADLAQDLLPRVDQGKDLWKKAPVKADVTAAKDALYAGTLWGGGSPLEGRIWTDEELKAGRAIDGAVSIEAFAPMTDKQIALYRQALAATGNSMDSLAKSLIHRLARSFGIGFDRSMSLEDVAQVVRDQIDGAIESENERINAFQSQIEDPETEFGDEDVRDAHKRLKREIERSQKQISNLETLSKSVTDIEAKATGLKDAGYFPAQRFGQYFLHVVKEGKQEYFGLYESKISAIAAKRALAKEFPGADIQQGVIPREKYRLFQGLSLDALETFSEYLIDEEGNSLAKDALTQAFLKAAVAERSVMKRHLHRKGIPGYSEDIARVLASFVVSSARATSSNYHTGEMLRLAQAIKSGDVSDYATKLARYLVDPQEEAHGVRGFLFAQYLGGSIASGMVNMTQPFMVTAPELSQYTSFADAWAKLGKAATDDPAKLTGKIKADFERAKKEGIVSPQEIHQLRADTGGGISGRSLALRKLSFAWGSIFSLAEQFNRKTTFLAAYRIAEDQKMADPYRFAVEQVAATQFTYNKGNRPMFSRGAIGSVVMTFKQFSISYLEMAQRLYKTDKVAFSLLVLTLMAAAGLEGLPFADDIEDLIDTIGQWMGFATNSKKQLRKFVNDTLGKDVGQVVLRGVSGLPFMPVDISARMGMANLIPGTSALKPSEVNKGRDVLEFLGPVGQFAPVEGSMAGRAIDRLLHADLLGVVKSGIATRAVANVAQGAEMLETGQYRDIAGKKVMDTGHGAAVFKMAGLQPVDVARQQQRAGEIRQDINIHNRREGEIAEKWARAYADGDRKGVQEARQQLAQWNKDNPEIPIRITAGQIMNRVRALKMSREQRTIKSTPPELRSKAREALQQ